MRILILQDDFPPQSFGGAGIVAFNLASALKEKGHEVFIITAVGNESEEGEINYEGLKVFKIYSNYHERWRAYLSLYNPQTVKRVGKIINDLRPDVVHAHNIHTHLSYYSLRLSKLAGAKVVLTAHDVMLFHYGKIAHESEASSWQQLKRFKKRYNPLRNLIIKYYLRSVDKIIAVSHALKEALNHHGIDNVTVVHNGIQVDNWIADTQRVEKFKARYNLVGKKAILFGGRLSAPKGGEQAIRMLGEVVKKVPETVLLIVGQENAYASEMKKLAGELGVENHILFTGWLSGDELRAAYHASDLVAVLSVYLDPFPTINLEAMACAKPVLGTCWGGTSEAVVNNLTGYVINPSDIQMTAGKAVELLSVPAEAAQLGLAGYERVTLEFNLNKWTRSYLDSFAKIL